MFLFSLVVAFGAYAGNTLSIGNVALNNTEPKKVAITLDNDDPVAALQFEVTTPEGVNIVGDFERNDARFAPGQTSNYKIFNPNRSQLLVVCNNKNAGFIGNSGVIGYITVQATRNALENGLDGKVELKNIKLSTFSGGKIESNQNSTSGVSVTSDVVTISTVDPFVINPGGQHVVSLSAQQNFRVSGIQAVVVLPEGFKILNDEVNKGERLTNGAAISVTPRSDGRSYGIVIYDLMLESNGIVNGNSGELFDFTVVAPENFTDATAQIQFKDVEFANMKPRTVYASPVWADMTNGKTAYDRAMGEVTALRNSLAEALKTIATNSPDVKDLFPGTEISTAIDDLEAAVNTAYNDYTLTPDYDNVMSPVEGIRDAIAKLVVDAASAQAEYEAAKLRQQKFDEANAVIAGLENQLNVALATIAETCPDVKDAFNGADLSAQIAALKQAVQDAFDNQTIVEEYETLMSPVTVIQDGIAKLLTDARAAQDKHNAEVAAYNKAQAALATLDNTFKSALETIAAECADVKGNFKGEKISAEIAALKKAVEEAHANSTLAADYDKVMAPVADIETAIAALIKDAQDSQKAFNEQKALDQARVNANAAIAALEQSLANALSTIATECPNVKQNFTGAEISAQIAVLRSSVNTAYENRTLSTDYDNVMSPVAGIEAAIAQLIADAKAAQQAYNDEQEAIKNLNEAKAKADAKISELNASLTSTLATIAETCPDVKNDFKGEAVTASIAALRAAVDKAFADKTLVENYDQVMSPVTGIEAAIAKLLTDAQAAQKAFNEQSALDQARAKANATITALEKALADALSTIATECPDVKQNFTGAAISAQITVLRNSVHTAYDNKTLVNDYDNVMAPVATIDAAIAQLIADAKAAQQKFKEDAEAEVARQEAYKNAKDRINELKASLNEALATIAETCPNVKNDFKGEAVTGLINDLSDAVQDAYESKTIATDYETVMAPATEIEAAIEQLIIDAQAAEQAYLDNKALEKAFADASQVINSLKDELKQALATIAGSCPDVRDDFKGEEISDDIAALEAAVKAAHDNKTLSASYEEVMAPATGISAAIAQLVTDAQAAQLEFERVEANNAAYEADLEEIENAQKALDEAIEKIKSDYPDYDYKADQATIQGLIDAQKKQADDALAAVATAGEYSNTVNLSAIEKMIDEMIENAKKSGLDVILAEPLEQNDKIFTLDGLQLQKVRHGYVNIIVRADGRVQKVYVK